MVREARLQVAPGCARASLHLRLQTLLARATHSSRASSHACSSTVLLHPHASMQAAGSELSLQASPVQRRHTTKRRSISSACIVDGVGVTEGEVDEGCAVPAESFAVPIEIT